MHKIQAKEFTLEDFSCEYLLKENIEELERTIEKLNKYRNKYKMSTLNKKTTILKDFGKYLVAHNLFEKNPFETLQFYNNKQLQKNTENTINKTTNIAITNIFIVSFFIASPFIFQ